MPTRNSRAMFVDDNEFRFLISFWNSTAHSTASTALTNSAIKESPPELNKLPLCFSNKPLSVFSQNLRLFTVSLSSFSICLL